VYFFGKISVLKSDRLSKPSKVIVSTMDRKGWTLSVYFSSLIIPKILKPNWAFTLKSALISTFPYSIKGKSKVRISEGAFSMFLSTIQYPCSAATVSGPFLNVNVPDSVVV
jgi:hypothetical protein